MKKFFEEFKAFAMRGNVVDMAVGVAPIFVVFPHIHIIVTTCNSSNE